MAERKIKAIIPSTKINMGGNLIEQPLPNRNAEYIDPFLLIHHWEDLLPGEQYQREVGVDPHPHRGFSPVTFVYKGAIRHQDSLGNSAVVGEGGTQWMFAGKGITHSERPSKELAENGGEMEIIQFWVNAPAKHKMKPAFYRPISKEETPVFEGDGYTIQVVCGEYEGVKGVLQYFMPLSLLRITVKEGTEFNLKLESTHNSILYLLDGELTINSLKTRGKDLVWLGTEGEDIIIKADKATRILVLSGEPIGEEVVKNGPFVMNTQSEIMEAMVDTQKGKMGILIEEF